MPITRELVEQLRHLVRPIATRVANTAARAFVQLVDDSTKMQLLQIGVLNGETIDGAEHFQPYGFSAVPLPGAEAIAIFPNGDRSHPLVFAAADRRYRPTDGDPGDVIMYGYQGAKVIMKATGDIEIQPAPGHEVLIRDAGGTVERLVKKGEYDAHTHPAPGGATSPPTTPATGTQRLRVQ